jgi:hypothetical protein
VQKFQIGKTYQTRSIGDHNCIIQATILKRTDKTVTAWDSMEGKNKTYRVKVWQEIEQFKPWGSYSMAPTLAADDEVTA